MNQIEFKKHLIKIDVYPDWNDLPFPPHLSEFISPVIGTLDILKEGDPNELDLKAALNEVVEFNLILSNFCALKDKKREWCFLYIQSSLTLANIVDNLELKSLALSLQKCVEDHINSLPKETQNTICGNYLQFWSSHVLMSYMKVPNGYSS